MANFKPIYAKNNPDWRIVYFPGGYWELQEFRKLPDGVDRRREQPWIAHNSRMTKADALQALGAHDKRKAA